MVSLLSPLVGADWVSESIRWKDSETDASLLTWNGKTEEVIISHSKKWPVIFLIKIHKFREQLALFETQNISVCWLLII